MKYAITISMLMAVSCGLSLVASAQSPWVSSRPREGDYYLSWYLNQKGDDDETVFILNGRAIGVGDEGLSEVIRRISVDSHSPKRVFVFPNHFGVTVGTDPTGASGELLAIVGSSQLKLLKQSGVTVVFCPDWDFQFESPPADLAGERNSGNGLTNSIGMTFAMIDVDRPVESSAAVKRSIESNYFMGKHEVTQAQYVTVMNNNPSHFRGNKLPVDSVKWIDVVSFCQKLTQIEEEKQSGRVYTPPTVYEWEFACSGGRASPYFFDSTGIDLERYAWFARNSGYAPHDVGLLDANPWGLHDTLGNVCEWCSGLEREVYAKVRGRYRPIRGGGWRSPRLACNLSVDDEEEEGRARADVGFRVVCRVHDRVDNAREESEKTEQEK